MVYRIRYKSVGAGKGEMVVEANSPTEALVKFRHAHETGVCANDPRETVMSVTPEYAENES